VRAIDKEERTAILAMPAVLIAGAAVGWMGSSGGGAILGLPAFAALYALAFLIQWVVFVPSNFFEASASSTSQGV